MAKELPVDNEKIARKTTLMAALTGEHPMTWDIWTIPIYDAECLTPQGREVALRAVATLRRFFGADFPQRAKAAHHSLLSGGFWPINRVAWVYANVFRLMAQLDLLGTRTLPLQQTMRRNLQHRSWTHSLLQLEVGSLGLPAGWQSTFEPALGNGRRADVLLTADSTNITVETVAMGISHTDLEAQTQGLSPWKPACL